MKNNTMGRKARSMAATHPLVHLEALEPRQLMSLLGIAAGFPLITTQSVDLGSVAYNATNQTFDDTATPSRFRLTNGGTPIVIQAPKDFALHIKVDNAGNLLGGVPGSDLVLTGAIDIDNDGTMEYSGTLLTAEVSQFGYDVQSGVALFDFRLVATGGSLLSLFAGKDVGLVITSESSTFTGSFATDFAGKTKGALGPITGTGSLPSTLSGHVFYDANNNGVDDNEPGINGVTITLTGADKDGNWVSRTTTTATVGGVVGVYYFAGLAPGTYTLTETQPAGYLDGLDHVGSLGGTLGNDVLSTIFVGSGVNGLNYDFGELLPQQPLGPGSAATIGFWHNKNGQALLRSLNGSADSTQLGDWLAFTLPNLYGATAGANNLAGKTNDYVASWYLNLFKTTTGQKLDCQIAAVAFAVYATNSNLAGGTYASQYGFNVDNLGTGALTINVGSSGAAFGVPNNSTISVLDALLAVNKLSANGVIYASDPTLRNLANPIFDYINTKGDIK